MGLVQLPFERLKGRENFSTWKVGAKAYLTTKGLWSSMIADPAADAKPEEVERSQKALSELILLVDSSLYSHLQDCETAKSGWDTLIKSFEDAGAIRQVGIIKQWLMLSLADCGSIQNYVNKWLELLAKVKKADYEIGDKLACAVMLCGLPEEFKPMIMGMEVNKDKLSLDYVKNVLLQEIDFDNGEEAALAVKHKKFEKKGKGTVKCYECGGPHFKRKCPRLRNDKESADVVLFSAYAVKEISNEWYIDSGATAHMTSSDKFLHNMRKSVKKEVIAANNERMEIKGVGDLAQSIILDNELSEVKLSDVQYIPGICANLLSVSQIVKKQYTVIFDINGCKILDRNKKVIATGRLENDMFKLNVVDSDFACSAQYNDNDLLIMHRRFGHASIGKLNILLNKNLQRIINCEVCVKGKYARKPFNELGKRATQILQIVHSDVCGPLNIRSIGGAKYFVTFIDDCSRKTFVYVLKTKNEVFDKFVQFKTLVENQTNNKVKVLRTDNGTEYINKNFDKFCVEHGIKHEKSAPYTPQQNGLSERMNRTLIEKVRCLLLDTSMKKGFWAEALKYAVEIVNVLPCAAENNKSPNEIWFSRKPELKTFRIFGCKSMVMIPKEKRKKLDDKAIECVLLGFAENAKAYRFYDKTRKVVIVSRDAVFF